MKGGKREGAGRPPAPPSAVIRIRLPLPLHQKVKELGGDIWVKRIINEAIDKVAKTPYETFELDLI